MTKEEYEAYRIAVLKHSIKTRLHKINPARFSFPGRAPYSLSEIVAIEMDQVFSRSKVENLFNRDPFLFKYLKRK